MSFQMGVSGLISVTLGVLDMKSFENRRILSIFWGDPLIPILNFKQRKRSTKLTHC